MYNAVRFRGVARLPAIKGGAQPALLACARGSCVRFTALVDLVLRRKMVS